MTTHRMSRTPEYYAWYHMVHRCYDKNFPAYKDYGGRGIKVRCKRWRKSVVEFYNDMGPCPPGYSLDRRNNNKGYSPKNCRWATWKQQQNNRRSNKLVLYKGKWRTVAQAMRKVGSKLRRSTVYDRLNLLGWGVKKALETPARVRNI